MSLSDRVSKLEKDMDALRAWLLLAPDLDALSAYSSKVLALSPIAYWPLNDPEGASSANSLVGAIPDGVLVGDPTFGVTGIGDGNSAASFDGTGDNINIYSAALASAFSGAEGSLSIWIKTTTAVWTDGSVRHMATFQVDADNQVYFSKASNNTIRGYYEAGSVVDQTAVNSQLDDVWQHLCLTWSAANDRAITYLGGIAQGTRTTLGTFAGSLGANTTAIAALNSPSSSQLWIGELAHVALFNKELTSIDVASLSVV